VMGMWQEETRGRLPATRCHFDVCPVFRLRHLDVSLSMVRQSETHIWLLGNTGSGEPSGIIWLSSCARDDSELDQGRSST